MSVADQEAAALGAMIAVLVVVFVVGVRRRNPWRFAAPICIVLLGVLVYLTLQGYVFGGPGFTVQSPSRP